MILDISHHQRIDDWASLSKEVEFVILRSSIEHKLDTKYLEFANACEKYDIPYGAYHYLKAGNIEEAKSEMEYFAEAARLRKPLFYAVDIEYDAQNKYNTNDIAEICYTVLKKLGLKKIGLYANQKRKFMTEQVMALYDWNWVPRYGKNTGLADDINYPPKYPCDLWQYCSTGKVNGIANNVDLNKLYGEKSLEYFTEKKMGIVTGGSVNIRKGPGTSYDIVTTAHKNDSVEILNTESWLPINFKGQICWISKKYIKI